MVIKYIIKDIQLIDVITLERYSQIKEELRNLGLMNSKGDISDEETKEVYRKLVEEVNKCEISFDNEEEFISFSKIKVKPEKWDAVIKHELEHAEIYKEKTVPVKYGFHKFKDNSGRFCYRPYVEHCFDETGYSDEERLKIEIESLKRASILSDQDKLDLEMKEKLLQEIKK